MNSVYKVTIYTDTAKIVFINRSHRFPNDLLLMVSRTLDFEDADMIFGRDILNNIFVNRGDTYLALVNGDSLSDYSNPWDEFIEFQIFDEKSPTRKSIVERSKSVEIEVSSIKTEFIHDMESFATKWLPQHTESLLRLFTLQDLKAQSFTPVYEIAHSSSLCAVFPENIICLCALLLHHFNYINEFHYNKVPEPFWNSTSDLIPFDKTCASFLKAIESEPCVSKNRQVIEINRKASQIFLTAGAGRKEDTVIYQLAKIINKYGFTKFRMEQTPFFVKFTNELAIDAGGPSNEILIEAINSAFHPSTQLFVQTINSGKTYFIPNPDAQEEINSVYSALGVILAIIIRTGALQNIPFAPFIWKYLAGEDILSSDIAEADEEFKTLLNHLNNGFIDNIKWTATTWDHKNVYNLSGGNDRQVYKEYINLYLQEYINFRIGLIKNQLQSIKNGFQANTGVDSHKFLCGKVLSWLAQGGGNVSVDNLKPVINFVGFSNDIESINQFWRVLERFNNEQLQLLLKFITTLSRIPNRTIDQNFKIRVYRLECNNPNDALPTASTCFKKLYLPKYESDDIAYRKLLYAIQFCQTMENN
ncbi:hypothetical protein TRFO_30260 [Tritrichomonas foetus]|uniref:HECT-type E3 ubiquitin transferase n=1 Tax=Tritrichomonas foetus TaxID=1144522 RepID=A0A1J4JV01_9EUKA|nr:hypothetical protein TRFO_30260 [Tritrichomonas foetus]|eukprot:OHT02538.1 hypothetical protein TRFO_30260 [Tritrichomonas foetus]